MAKEKEVEVSEINRLDVVFGQVDLNLVVDKINEVITVLNTK